MNATKAFLIMCCAGSLFLAQAGQVSLKQAQEVMLFKNLDMVIAHQEYCKKLYEEGEAKAVWYPSLDIIGSSAFLSEKNSISFPRALGGGKLSLGTHYRAEAGVDLSWPLTAAFVNIYNVRYRRLALTQKEAQNQGLKNQLSFRLGLLYLSWVLSYGQVEVYKTLTAQLSQQVKLSENFARSGTASASRVLEAKAGLAAGLADLIAAQNQSDSLKLELVTLIQTDDTGIVPMDYCFPADTAAGGTLDSVSLNLARPELVAIDLGLRQLSVYQDMLSGQKYPNFVAVVGYRYANPGLSMGDSVFMGFAQAGLQLRWNLFDGWKVSSQHRQAAQQMEIAGQQRRQIIDNWNNAIKNAKLQLSRCARQQEAADASLEAANALVKDAKNKLDAGVITQTDYLNALTSQARAALSVKTAQFQKNRSVLQLYFQAGKELKF
jgi:outer membrane protein TolC